MYVLTCGLCRSRSQYFTWMTLAQCAKRMEKKTSLFDVAQFIYYYIPVLQCEEQSRHLFKCYMFLTIKSKKYDYWPTAMAMAIQFHTYICT